MYRFQLCRIDDLVVLKVVDSHIGDEVKTVAEHSAGSRIVHQVGAMFKNLAGGNFAAIRLSLPSHHAIRARAILHA